MKEFIQVFIKVPDEQSEWIVARAANESGFLGIEEGFDEITVYFDSMMNGHQTFIDWVTQNRTQLLISSIRIDNLPEQNWNKQWEDAIKPVIVDDLFCIYPGWSPPDSKWPVEIRIDPKMSFGTGYHETTRLMLRAMKTTPFGSLTVLDCGTGTGILAIAAIRLGARQVIAFDTDEWAVNNTVENIRLNRVEDQITVLAGDFSVIPENEHYPVILSNVNRMVHLLEIGQYKKHLTPGGRLIISGLLVTDQPDIYSRFSDAGFRLQNTWAENEWLAMEWTL